MSGHELSYVANKHFSIVLLHAAIADLVPGSREPSPYVRGIPALFCQRQNTGQAGLDDHYSPVS
ncbi:hypothetical protein M5362_31300 [Streptomyces sp. Je 1-79]|uniref:hypothetical protein n=1 Tax=Streptomyces sp. Je 1-79 TaxID=2943847 RepID=UPI0021A2E7D7|nr:hypothetical protein [Streptomyces sp. Je 1-79]MCT4357594.1 hypothetical protein [Streptomyces sp. Je 1-79]